MHSAYPTSGRSVRKTPRGHEGAITLKWGICFNIVRNMRFLRQKGMFGAEFDGADRGRRPSHHPSVTATGEGRP